MFIDSHCHLDCLDLTPFDGSFDRFVDSAQQQGIDHMLCVSINWEDYPAMRQLVQGYNNISVSVGVHPNEREGHDPTEQELIDLARKDHAVAIGETGLDYFRSDGDLEWQHQRFRTHLRAAKTLQKPVIIHTREAQQDTIRLMQEESAGEAGGVMHCFTEDWTMARQALDMDFYISFSGIVTFKNAQQVHEVAKKVPLDRLLIETDSPYLAPVPKRGKPNYPTYVRHVAEGVASLRGLDVEEVAGVSAENFHRLFSDVATKD